MEELGEKFIELDNSHLYEDSKIFYLWEHAYELDAYHMWDRLDAFLQKMSGHEDIWYATNGEIYEYLDAVKQLQYSSDGSLVYNPTDREIWMLINEEIYQIKSGTVIEIKILKVGVTMKNAKVQKNPGMDGRAMKQMVIPLLPSPEYDTCEIKECEIMLPDGVRLAASISSPDFSAKWPVILMRYPYIMYDWMKEFYHELFAEHGYAVALVQVRGAVHSEGEFQALEESKDGRDVIDWLAEQPWCDGNIATIGASYCGNTQWSIADYHHPMLKTMFISVFGAESYDVFYHRGLFRAEVWTEWTAQMFDDNKYSFKTGVEGNELRERAFSANPQIKLGEHLNGKTCEWYTNWTSNWRGNEEYWKTGYWGQMEKMPEQVQIPIFLHAGWFDIFLHAMVSSYQRLPQKIKDQSVFMIGPWGHSGLASGDLQYPGEEKAGYLQIAAALRWFDYIIKGKEYTEPVGCIEAYNIGENKWEIWKNDFSHNKELTYYLDSSFKENKAYSAYGVCPSEDSVIAYNYDPENPVPSRGGTLIVNHNDPTAELPEGSCLQEPIGAREDVLSFVTEPFTKSEKITGSIKVHLFVSSNVPATAFTVKISEIFDDGRTLNIRDDFTDIRWRDRTTIKEYTPEEIVELIFDVLEIDWTLKEGSRLRIDISSSSYPLFLPHKNTEVPWAEETKSQVAHQKIYTGKKYPSRVILPITNPI